MRSLLGIEPLFEMRASHLDIVFEQELFFPEFETLYFFFLGSHHWDKSPIDSSSPIHSSLQYTQWRGAWARLRQQQQWLDYDHMELYQELSGKTFSSIKNPGQWDWFGWEDVNNNYCILKWDDICFWKTLFFFLQFFSHSKVRYVNM